MYQVTYYFNRMPYFIENKFDNLFSAVFTAKAILQQHGFATDIMDCANGEIVAIFEPGNIYITENATDETKHLAELPL